MTFSTENPRRRETAPNQFPRESLTIDPFTDVHLRLGLPLRHPASVAWLIPTWH